MENSRGKKLIQLVKLQNLKEQHRKTQEYSIPPNRALSATDSENNNEEEIRDNVNSRYEDSNGESDVEPYEDSGSEWQPSGSEKGVSESIAGVIDSEAVTEDNRKTDLNVEGSEGRKKRGRKIRILNQSRKKRKRMANSNLKYVSARNKIIEPKKFNANYVCTCSKRFHIDAKIRKKLF
ncbi:hypothetical protein JTB14_005137 [Gonioctena quinquepunctata]|nr:hypothetical protein JTB14_005137 [Gonioctena quinquepunctata]